MSHLRSLLMVVVVLAGSGACVSVPPTPDDRYYRLRPPSGTPEFGASLQGSLHVERFRVDGVLRERALVYSEDAGQRVLNQHSYHFWADSPARLLHDYWTVRLRDLGAGNRRAQTGEPETHDYLLGGRILRLERLLGADRQAVALGLELRLRTAGGAHILRRRYEVIEPADSGQVLASVQAWERALEKVIAQFLDDLASAPRLAVRD